MINDFNEIKNEKDRELYVQLRNVLDVFFMYKVNLHKDKNHPFNECESLDIYKELRNMFPNELKEECKKSQLSEIEVIEMWINHNESKMLMYMSSLIILRAEYDKRKQ